MFYRMKLLLTVCVLIQWSQLERATAQFERVDAVVAKIDERFHEQFGNMPSLESADQFGLSSLERFLFDPLNWELKKIEIRSRLLTSRIKTIEEKMANSREQWASINARLFEYDVNDQQDLSKLLTEKREQEKEIEINKLEVEALSEVGSNDRESEKRELERKQAEIALGAQDAVVEQLRKTFERTNDLASQGLTSSHDLEIAKAKVAEAETKKNLLRVELRKAELDTVPSFSRELRVAMARLDRMVNRETAPLNVELFAELQSLVRMKQELAYASTALGAELTAVQTQLAQLRLEQQYLESIIDAYTAKVPAENTEADEVP